jgi:hypothetical protein
MISCLMMCGLWICRSYSNPTGRELIIRWMFLVLSSHSSRQRGRDQRVGRVTMQSTWEVLSSSLEDSPITLLMTPCNSISFHSRTGTGRRFIVSRRLPLLVLLSLWCSLMRERSSSLEVLIMPLITLLMRSTSSPLMISTGHVHSLQESILLLDMVTQLSIYHLYTILMTWIVTHTIRLTSSSLEVWIRHSAPWISTISLRLPHHLTRSGRSLRSAPNWMISCHRRHRISFMSRISTLMSCRMQQLRSLRRVWSGSRRWRSCRRRWRRCMMRRMRRWRSRRMRWRGWIRSMESRVIDWEHWWHLWGVRRLCMVTMRRRIICWRRISSSFMSTWRICTRSITLRVTWRVRRSSCRVSWVAVQMLSTRLLICIERVRSTWRNIMSMDWGVSGHWRVR